MAARPLTSPALTGGRDQWRQQQEIPVVAASGSMLLLGAVQRRVLEAFFVARAAEAAAARHAEVVTQAVASAAGAASVGKAAVTDGTAASAVAAPPRSCLTVTQRLLRWTAGQAAAPSVADFPAEFLGMPLPFAGIPDQYAVQQHQQQAPAAVDGLPLAMRRDRQAPPVPLRSGAASVAVDSAMDAAASTNEPLLPEDGEQRLQRQLRPDNEDASPAAPRPPSAARSIYVDPAPFSVSVFTPLTKVHYLFAICLFAQMTVTREGRLCGIILKDDLGDAGSLRVNPPLRQGEAAAADGALQGNEAEAAVVGDV